MNYVDMHEDDISKATAKEAVTRLTNIINEIKLNPDIINQDVSYKNDNDGLYDPNAETEFNAEMDKKCIENFKKDMQRRFAKE